MCMTFLFQNKLKVIPLTSFVGIMSQREGVIILQAIFQHHQILASRVGHDQAIDLLCQVAPWGYLLRKICRGLVLGGQMPIQFTSYLPPWMHVLMTYWKRGWQHVHLFIHHVCSSCSWCTLGTHTINFNIWILPLNVSQCTSGLVLHGLNASLSQSAYIL